MDAKMTEDALTFGEFFKKKRIGLRKTLREFCREHELDPGNISKLERGRVQPPQNKEILLKYAGYLQLDGDERQTFHDLAAIGANRIPEDLTEAEVAKRLPLFFRTIRGKDFSEEKLRELAKKIAES